MPKGGAERRKPNNYVLRIETGLERLLAPGLWVLNQGRAVRGL